MTTPYTSFIVTLTKTRQGYCFDSMTAPAANAKKGHDPAPPRNSRIQNRLIKEIQMLQEDDLGARAPAPTVSDPARPDSFPPPSFPDIDCDVKRPVFVPKSSPSFSTQLITPVQRANFPNIKEELYLKYRNFMVDTYNANPNRYLTFIACRKVLRGNVNVLMRIYKYLSKQELINYNLDYKGNYTFLDAAPLMKPPCNTEESLSHSATEKWSIDTDALTFVSINKYFSRGLRVYCDECRLIGGAVWYMRDDRHLCFECHARLGTEEAQTYTPLDIVKKLQLANKEPKTQKSAWSIEENIKLLEFMGSSGGGTWEELLRVLDNRRTVEDVIVQFMQFPIITSQTPLSTRPHLRLPMQQHLLLLHQYYDRSHYSKGQTNGYTLPKPHTSNKFRAIATAVLQRYAFKMHCLNAVERCIENTNIQIHEDKFINKCDH